MRFLVSVAVFGLVPAPAEAVTSGQDNRATHADPLEMETGLRCMLRGERMATKEEIANILHELKGILKQAA
jgi:hypothetical protein